MGASLAKKVASLCVLFGLCACGATPKGAERPSEASKSSPSSSPSSSEPNGVSSSVEDLSRLALGSSACYIKYWFDDPEKRAQKGAVVMPDGSMVQDFSSGSGALIVQHCFYDAGLEPDDETIFLLLERVLWRGSAMTIIRSDSSYVQLLDLYGATFAPPVIERQEDGFVVHFQAVEGDTVRLLSVVATITPSSVDFAIKALGEPENGGSNTG